MRKLLFTVIIIGMVLGCSSCASLSEQFVYMPESEHADKDGMVCVTRIKSKGSAIHESKKGEYKSDSKQKNFLDGFSLIRAGG